MFEFTIKTPYEDVFASKVESVSLSTEGGDMQVFADHASVTGAVLFSPVVVKGEADEEFLVRNGLFLFDNEANRGTLLTTYCEKKAEVNYQTAKEYADFIEQQLREGKELSEFQILYLKGEKFAVEEQMKDLEG